MKGKLPIPRSNSAMCIIDNKGFLFGGDFKGSRLNDLWVINLKSL